MSPRSQWIAIDVYFTGSTLYQKLLSELGPAGPLAWINLISWAKRTGRDGAVKYVSTYDALDNLGLLGADLGRPPEDWLEDFWRLLARMKQASRNHVRSGAGAGRKARVTNYKAWQKDRGSVAGASRPGTSEGISDEQKSAPTRHDIDATTTSSSSGSAPSQEVSASPPPKRGRGGDPKPANGHAPPLVAAAIEQLATRRLDQALVAANAGRREPIHHPTGWLAATAEDLEQHTAALAGLAEAEGITDPAALADAWERRHGTPDEAAGPVYREFTRCGQCGDLDIDCVCR